MQIVDRSTFHRIKRPIIIFFNHFRELFYHHSKWLDIFRRVALKFADRIEFIAGDQLDIDLIHPYVNPLNFFSCFIRPQDEDPTVFAIDENKQIFEYCNIHKTEENFCELCENLLNGSLYASQPIPDKQEHLVKIAVHHNYNVLVTNSTKDTFLIVGLGDYQPHQENEPDYEQVAEELKDSNIQLVYIDGDKNYIPFEFYANCYPTLIFISHKDKRDFIHYDREPRDTENILKFLNENICPLGKSWRSEQHLALQYRAFTLPTDKDRHFEDLNEYLSEHFPKSLKVFNRNTFGTLNNSIIIYFMDFKEHGLPHYISSLQMLCQVAQAYHGFGIEYLIADLQDLDVLYPIWYE